MMFSLSPANATAKPPSESAAIDSVANGFALVLLTWNSVPAGVPLA
jgi:hypothetical protein